MVEHYKYHFNWRSWSAGTDLFPQAPQKASHCVPWDGQQGTNRVWCIIIYRHYFSSWDVSHALRFLAKTLKYPMGHSLLQQILQVSKVQAKMSRFKRSRLASKTKRTILGLNKELRFFVDTYLVCCNLSVICHFHADCYRSKQRQKLELILKQWLLLNLSQPRMTWFQMIFNEK